MARAELALLPLAGRGEVVDELGAEEVGAALRRLEPFGGLASVPEAALAGGMVWS